MAGLRGRGLSPAIRYVSDSGTLPYGRQDADELRGRVERVCAYLAGEGCSRVVVACNAASTVVPRVHCAVPVHGILGAGVRAGLGVGGVVGVVGGVRTIRDGHHRRELEARGRVVRAAVAQPWSALVERGLLAGPEVDEAVQHVLSELGAVDALLLACTHYPALVPTLQRLAPGVLLVDPIEGVIDELLEVLPPPGELVAETTGDPTATGRSARLAWGLEVDVARADLRLWP